ncbi:hypothetical protein [Ketogulonicigenium vulgare]|uniref:hypothetical protein n=1 Tax=Ketogulonicigenium vulgare TaxID=92945 RepID=UPI00235894B0|nr:hypothetical protein [Ketogulonicigenium vulgare]
MIYAAQLNKENVVTRVEILGEGGDLGDLVMIGRDNTVGLGWAYADGQFVPPEVEDDPLAY